IRLAYLLRKHLEQPDEGDAVVDRMVAANDKNWEAYFARGYYRRNIVVGRAALDDFLQAAGLAPERTPVVWAVVNVAWPMGDAVTARAALNHLSTLEPGNPAPYHFLGILERRAGRVKEAEVAIRRGLEAVPDDRELLSDLTDVLLEQDRIADVEPVLARLEK